MTITRLLLVIVVPLAVASELLVHNETYRKAKGEIQFTRVDLGSARSKIQCFTKCSGDSGCLGVGVQKINEGMFRCSQMNEDSAGTSASVEELVYLKVKRTDTSSSEDIPCAEPFIKIGDLAGCYYPVVEQVTWQEAEDACQNLNPSAHLISFESLEERTVIPQSLGEGYSTFWTGGKDHNGDDQLTWTGTGEEIPDDADYWYYETPGDDDCVFMYAADYNLDARTCDGRLSYICEIH